MSGSKINDYSIGDENIQSVMLTLDKAYKGLHQVSLTNYDTTAESQIAAGSVVENNGALYTFNSNESITGSPSDGTVYIRLVPAGDTITAEYTNTAPTWSDSKQGWYGTGGDVNKRYLEFEIIKTSSIWLKRSYANQRTKDTLKDRSLLRAYRDTDLNFPSGTNNITVVFDKVSTDSNLEYNNSTGIFKAKRGGFYLMRSSFDLSITSLPSLFIFIYMQINGANFFRFGRYSSEGLFNPSGETYVYLNIGDEVKINLNKPAAGVASLTNASIFETLFEIIEV